MKVLVIAPSAHTLGGTQTWLDYLLPGLADAGCQVTLGLTSGRHHDADSYLRHHPFANSIRIAAPTGTREGRITALAAAIIEQSPDLVVVLNIVDVYEAVARVRLEQKLRIKVVATLHGLQPDFLQDFRAFAAHLDAVICSNRLAQTLVRERCGLAAARVLYAPYGVSLRASQDAVLREPRTAGAPLRIGYAGRLESPQKRVCDLPVIVARAVQSGLDVTLRIAGSGPEEAALRQAFANEKVSDRVTFLGVLDASSLREQLYRTCDVLLLTSSWETGPIVAWEALSENAVLLTSDYLGRRAEGSLVDDENCIVFAVGDVEGAVLGIAKLMDPQLRKQLARAGRGLIRARYSHARSIRSWHKCLRAVHNMRSIAATNLPAGEVRGRLDRALGSRFGERVRQLLGRRYRHTEPGGEWPHTRGTLPEDDAEFWSWARSADVVALASEKQRHDLCEEHGE